MGRGGMLRFSAVDRELPERRQKGRAAPGVLCKEETGPCLLPERDRFTFVVMEERSGKGSTLPVIALAGETL